MITKEVKNRIVEAMNASRKNYSSNARFATAIGINAAQLSRVLNGDLENVVADNKWISIARRLDVHIGNATEMVTANTPVFKYINAQLATCQQFSLSGMLCDDADIGKTYAAKHFVKTAKNAVYVDCSQVKTKQKLVRFIAKELGLNGAGRYQDIYEDVAYYLRSISYPIIILDEAGDLDYGAWLELKALWNATERACAWYMMGADGLKDKIERNMGRKKVGYVEIFSRYGGKYEKDGRIKLQKVTPEGGEEKKAFTRQQVALIAKVNGISDVQKLYAQTGGSLRRIYTEIQKRKAQEATS
ncbi:AAA family ATPase [Labilibaculum manganireducens]|uniref:AAA family ATPase n=1 Tax=Labilibaculum manganireducens TaxID=1940525 RepID=A0A2N3IGA8_9BACT|nr:AAA family ATPase [Labilibaculum manganireducens]PKQ69359.1 AAA family ATPase [Labilibaculum manganireducens]